MATVRDLLAAKQTQLLSVGPEASAASGADAGSGSGTLSGSISGPVSASAGAAASAGPAASAALVSRDAGAPGDSAAGGGHRWQEW